MPAGQTLAHLRRRFNPIASLLLSAESLSDMSERKILCRVDVYFLVTLLTDDVIRHRIYGLARDDVGARQSCW